MIVLKNSSGKNPDVTEYYDDGQCMLHPITTTSMNRILSKASFVNQHSSQSWLSYRVSDLIWQKYMYQVGLSGEHI